MTDPKDLTPEEMARVKALDAAATPGPWDGSSWRYVRAHAPHAHDEFCSKDGCFEAVDTMTVCQLGDVGASEQLWDRPHGELIAEYRSLLPRAVAQLERLQAAHATLTAQRCETCRHVVHNPFNADDWWCGKFTHKFPKEIEARGCTAYEPKEPSHD